MMPPIEPTSRQAKHMREGFVAGFLAAAGDRPEEVGDPDEAFDVWLAEENARRTAPGPYRGRGA